MINCVSSHTSVSSLSWCRLVLLITFSNSVSRLCSHWYHLLLYGIFHTHTPSSHWPMFATQFCFPSELLYCLPTLSANTVSPHHLSCLKLIFLELSAFHCVLLLNQLTSELSPHTVLTSSHHYDAFCCDPLLSCLPYFDCKVLFHTALSSLNNLHFHFPNQRMVQRSNLLDPLPTKMFGLTHLRPFYTCILPYPISSSPQIFSL